MNTEDPIGTIRTDGHNLAIRAHQLPKPGYTTKTLIWYIFNLNPEDPPYHYQATKLWGAWRIVYQPRRMACTA